MKTFAPTSFLEAWRILKALLQSSFRSRSDKNQPSKFIHLGISPPVYYTQLDSCSKIAIQCKQLTGWNFNLRNSNGKPHWCSWFCICPNSSRISSSSICFNDSLNQFFYIRCNVKYVLSSNTFNYWYWTALRIRVGRSRDKVVNSNESITRPSWVNDGILPFVYLIEHSNILTFWLSIWLFT